MIAYSKTWLDNLHLQEQAAEALASQCITEAEQAAIKARYPVGFYTPNFFIRIGLFVLTGVVACFTLGIFFLFAFSSSNMDSPIGLLFFMAILSYAMLELFVREKRHYRSGVDDALLWATVIFFVSALNFFLHIHLAVYALLVGALAGYLALRFADALASGLAALCGLGFVFFAYLEVGAIAKLTMPFAMMVAAAVLYFCSRRIAKASAGKYYQLCWLVVKVVALLSFYVTGNYFVVREVGNTMFDLNLKAGERIPLGWLFWALTVGVPMLYMYRGVQKKDAVFLRVGLLLLAAMVVTIRYYYHVMPLEGALLIGGVVMIAVAYFLIRYLAQPRHGFTYQEGYDPSPINKLQVEALVINQTFSTPQVPATTGTRFGGGSGGGAGAGGSY